MSTDEKYLTENFARDLRRNQILHKPGLGAGVSFLDRKTFLLPIRKEHLTALGASKDSILYASLLLNKTPGNRHKEPNDDTLETSNDLPTVPKRKPAHHPFATLILTPVPPVAWSRALRICFSSPSNKPGQLRQLTERLRDIGLYVRHVDAMNGIDMDGYSMLLPDGKFANLLPNRNQRPLTQPTIIVMVELPLQQKFEKSADENTESDNVVHLAHKYIECWSSDKNDYSATLKSMAGFVEKLSKELNQPTATDGRTINEKFRIEWVSPLQTIHGLKTTAESEDTGAAQLPASKLRVIQDEHDEKFSVSLERWRKILDPGVRYSIEESASPGRPNLCAIVSADTEERTLVAHFVPIERYAVLQFEIIHPAGWRQHIWKEWIYSELGEANGTIIHAFSQGRIGELWARELIVCYFRFVANEADSNGRLKPCAEKISNITKCVRALQGFELNGCKIVQRYSTVVGCNFLDHLNDSDARKDNASKILPDFDNIDGYETRKFGYGQRWDTTLRNLKAWYRWPQRTDREYKTNFTLNKFNFTLPLCEDRLLDLYPSEFVKHSNSRMRLVERLVETILKSENSTRSALVLGSHRSGKTSILNIAREKIDKEPDCFAVMINGTVTPPHMLLMAVYQELAQDKQELAQDKNETSKILANAIKDSFEKFFNAKLRQISIIGLGSLSFGNSEGGNENSIDDFKAREIAEMWSTDEGKAAFLRTSIEIFRKALKEMVDLSTVKPNGTELKLVIILDEVSSTAAWGNQIAFPVWRSVIESRDFANVRWLLSSTRPLNEATSYSPLGNAVREFALRALSDAEADHLINNFEEKPKHIEQEVYAKPGAAEQNKAYGNKVQANVEEVSREDHENGANGVSEKIPFVVTYQARNYIKWVTGRYPYFLQLICTHLYERTVSYHIPIISEVLVRNITRVKAIPELSDFFYSQVRNIDKELLDRITNSLVPSKDPLNGFVHDPLTISSIERRKLQLAGLGWSEGECVIVPLFAHWLWSGVYDHARYEK